MQDGRRAGNGHNCHGDRRWKPGGAKSDRDVVAASERLDEIARQGGTTLDSSSTNAEIALALLNSTPDTIAQLAAVKADRDLVAANSAFIAALARLKARGLSGDSTDAEIVASFHPDTDIATAKIQRDLLQLPPPAADDTVGKFERTSAINHLKAFGLIVDLTANPSCYPPILKSKRHSRMPRK
jgi:hypothetical protein